METTQKQRTIIEAVIRRRANNKKKWAYPLGEMIEEKRQSNTALTYTDISEWLSSEGLVLSESIIRKIIYEYKKKLKKEKQEVISVKNESSTQSQPIRIEPETENNSVDLNEVLRQRVNEAKKKGAGFDAFRDL